MSSLAPCSHSLALPLPPACYPDSAITRASSSVRQDVRLLGRGPVCPLVAVSGHGMPRLTAHRSKSPATTRLGSAAGKAASVALRHLLDALALSRRCLHAPLVRNR